MPRLTSTYLSLSLSAMLCAVSFCAAYPKQSGAQSSSSNPSAAQNGSQSSTASPEQTPATVTDPNAAPVKKSKKVWTNENMSDASGPISVVGDNRGIKGKTSPQSPADPQYIAKTKKDLQKLQEQIDDANKQLATLKSFSEGEPVGSGAQEFHKGYNNQPIEQQRVNLEAKKKDLQAKIDALLDEARKKGVEPGQLRQ
jgi:hypothetical protein